MAPASAASPGVPGIPGDVGAWLPGSPQAHELGMLGGAWLPTPPPATPGGVGLGNDAGGGQVYDTGEDDENDDCPLDETVLEDDGCDEPELPETLEDCRDPELLEELELLDELELRELLGEEDDEGCELALEDDLRDDELDELEKPPMAGAPYGSHRRARPESIVRLGIVKQQL